MVGQVVLELRNVEFSLLVLHPDHLPDLVVQIEGNIVFALDLVERLDLSIHDCLRAARLSKERTQTPS